MKTTRLFPLGLAGWMLSAPSLKATVRLDQTFTPGDGPDGAVQTMAIVSGDRILIGGSFQHYQGVARPGLARLLPNGMLDDTFDPTGALAGEVQELVPLREGGVLVGGRFSLPGNTNAGIGLARLEWDGRRDPTFAPPLTWRTEAGIWIQNTFGLSSVGGIVPPRIRFGLAPDQSVVLDARAFRVAGREINTLVRLRPDGSWDESFRPELSLRDWDVRRVAVAPDGRVWVAGHLGGPFSPVRFGLVHFLADGAWDRGFSPVDLPPLVEDIALLPGGLVVGYGADPQLGWARVFRLLPDGARDPTFATAELPVLPGTMAVSADGRAFLAPFVKSVNGIRRNELALLDPAGRVVVNFDLIQGPERGDYGSFWATAAFDRQGRVLFSSNFKRLNGEPCASLVRLEEAPLGPPYSESVYWGAPSYSVSEDAGKVTLLCVRAGPVSRLGLTTVPYATRPESALEGSDFVGQTGLLVFGNEQVRLVEIPILDDALEEGAETFQVVLYPGTELPPEKAERAVTRVFILDNDASYHISFLGQAEVNASESDAEARIPLHIATSAKLISPGSPLVPPDALVEVEYEERGARAGRDYLPLVRPLFQNVDPVDNLDPVGVYARFRLPILDNADRDGPRQVRLHLRGRSPRVVFNPSAATLVINITDNDTAAGAGRFIRGSPDRLTPARGGRWLISGNFDAVDALPRPGLARLEPDGAVDETFTPAAGPDGPIQVLLEGPGGEVLVAGQFRRVGERVRSSAARFLPNGEFDESFMPPDGWDAESVPVNYLAGGLQADGRLVLAGVGRFHGPGLSPGVVRLLPDGRADPDFHLVELGLSELTAFALLPDQQILVAGRQVLTWTGTLRRLRPDGQPDPDFELSSPATISALWGAAEGSIWVGTGAGLVRLPPGLQVPPGSALTGVGQWIHTTNTLALAGQPDGRILAAWRDREARVGRFEPDGTPDPDFNRFTFWPPLLVVTDSGFIGTLESYQYGGRLRFHRYSPAGQPVYDVHIERLVRLPTGEVHGRLRGQGVPVVQRSTKLRRDWVDVYVPTRFPAWPPFNFVDTNAVRHPYAFYRVRRW